MKILILGTNGILGHTLFLFLKSYKNLKILGLCGKSVVKSNFYKFNYSNLKILDLTKFDLLEKEIELFNPDFVINCAVKKNIQNNDTEIIEDIKVNIFLPHHLSNLASVNCFKLIHISTDSIFGSNGAGKTEFSSFNVEDLYSATKLLGEPFGENSIIIRTSIIGHSLKGDDGLLDWVLNQDNLTAFSNVFFAGTTSLELSKIIYNLILESFNFSNRKIYHVTGLKISRLELINKISNIYSLDRKVIPTISNNVDRSISSQLFLFEHNYVIPPWDSLLADLQSFFLKNKIIYAK